MTLSFGLSPVLLVVCLLAAAGVTYWSYRGTVPRISRAKRYVLMALRFGVLFLILLLLFQPVLRRLDRDEYPPVLAVLVDDSESLQLTMGAGDSSAVDLDGRVRRVLDGLPAGLKGQDARFFRFAEDVRALPETDAPTDSLDFKGTRTDISRALSYVRDALRDENLGGVLLLSDGRYNTGRNPLYAAERFPVPVYTVTLGDTTQRRDLQVRRVTTNEIAYVDAELPIQVGLRTEGYGGETATVSLVLDGQVLSSARVQLPGGTAEVPVDLAFTPDREGLQRLTVTATHLDGETTYRNNEESITVRVLESKRRILLVGAAPSPDVAATRQILEDDPAAEVTTFVQKGPGTFYQGAFPVDLSAFDVMVMAGFPGRGADENVLRSIVQAAGDGTPLLFMTTRETDVGRAARALAEVLPVVNESVRGGFVEAMLVPTAAGARHPILQIAGAEEAGWRLLPPLVVNQSRWRATPDARVLATMEVRGVALDDPLLVIRQRSGHRVAALMGAGTWRWKNVPDDLEAVAGLWPALLSNVVQWLSAREDDRPVRVEPVRDLFDGDEAVTFTGQVYDESLNPVDDASIEVTVTAEDGADYPYVMDAVGNGRYTLGVGTLPEGTYTYAAEARRDDVLLGTDAGSFAVGSLTLEFKDTQADAALMRQIAQRSGGAALSPDGLDALGPQLAASGTFAPMVVEEERSTELWHLYAFLAAIIALLATEWFLRKRAGMV